MFSGLMTFIYSCTIKNNNNMKPFLLILFYSILLFGEIRCIYKAATCNWEPIGKSEVFYTLSAFTGLGVVVGYINIQDK